MSPAKTINAPDKALPRLGRASIFTNILNSLLWLWLLSALIALKPFEVHATKQKAVRKEATKDNPALSSAPKRKTSKPPSHKVIEGSQEATPVDPLEIREHVGYRVRSGDTLLGILNRFSLPLAEKKIWRRSIQRNYGKTALRAGQEINFYFAKPTTPSRGKASLAQLQALELDHDEASTLSWEKGTGGIFFQKREKPYDVELKTAGATVESSIFEDGHKAGVHPNLLSQLVDIFSWELDIGKEIRRGDSFKILYEQRSRKGLQTKTSYRILAAELISSGQTWTALYFEKHHGEGNYYNLEGRSLARSFLRFPLEFTNITSHFDHSRFHPIRKVHLPHTGVDFAAKRGTPVRAIGDGVITQAGRNGGYGKVIDIQHDSTYMSRYAHLGRFADGIRNGVAVKKGQIIGYVGSTGRTTGAHLHFEFYKDQVYIDPLSVDVPAEEWIEPALQRLFENQKQLFLVEMTSAPQT